MSATTPVLLTDTIQQVHSVIHSTVVLVPIGQAIPDFPSGSALAIHSECARTSEWDSARCSATHPGDTEACGIMVTIRLAITVRGDTAPGGITACTVTDMTASMVATAAMDTRHGLTAVQ